MNFNFIEKFKQPKKEEALDAEPGAAEDSVEGEGGEKKEKITFKEIGSQLKTEQQTLEEVTAPNKDIEDKKSGKLKKAVALIMAGLSLWAAAELFSVEVSNTREIYADDSARMTEDQKTELFGNALSGNLEPLLTKAGLSSEQISQLSLLAISNPAILGINEFQIIIADKKIETDPVEAYLSLGKNIVIHLSEDEATGVLTSGLSFNGEEPPASYKPVTSESLQEMGAPIQEWLKSTK